MDGSVTAQVLVARLASKYIRSTNRVGCSTPRNAGARIDYGATLRIASRR
jgi:hypothetical protein